MQQQEDLQLDENKCLLPVFELMNEMLLFLAEIEANGIMIDLDELGKVETEFVAEKKAIEQRLKDTVTEVMGDTPINFNSGADMSKVIYSRELKDKEHWRRIMNLGTGANGKPLPPARMSQSQFVQAVRVNCEKVYRTIAYHCDACKGTGKIRKLKKDGKPYKNLSKCSSCDGQGFTLMSNGKIAGLKMSPSSTADCSVHGFKTDKVTLKRLIGQAMDKDNLQAVQFLTDITRLNAISTYLDSFVKNIQMYTRPDGRLHAQFNQTITRTGRLSSSYPNFQNLPKGGKFPVRKAIVSRWASEGGAIMEMDFSGLEFRVAGELSRDPQIIEDILGGKDVHKQTASIINQCSVDDVTKDMRQAAKAYTFAPLYGGMGAGEPEHVQTYFREYFNIYQGLKRWHSTLMDGVLKNGIVRTPSGREFMFKGAKRLRNGRITNATAVVNYPVQSFATADIVPLSCVRALRRFRKDGLKSKIILTVHDSIVVDVAPFEQPAVYEALRWAMQDVGEELQERFGYTPVLPLDTEAELGENWMETTTVSVDS
jgi:DNA polymerase I-like protein with 3'-5' exonuclease and polymerase domains